MKKMITVLSAMLLAFAVQAQNLIENPNFDKTEKKARVVWAKVGTGKINIQEGKGIVRLESADDKTPATCSVRQSVFKKLIKGKKYQLQCKVKGDKFKREKNADYGFMLVNRSWKGSVGSRRFIVPEDKPVTIKKVVTVPDNWTDAIVVAFAANITGALEFSELQLTEVQ